MLMVGAKVLFNSAKMLKMGVLVVFMHNYGQQEALIDIITLVVLSKCACGAFTSHLGMPFGWGQGMFFQPALRPYYS